MNKNKEVPVHTYWKGIPQTLTIPNIDEDEGIQNESLTSLSVSYKIKHTFTI